MKSSLFTLEKITMSHSGYLRFQGVLWYLQCPGYENLFEPDVQGVAAVAKDGSKSWEDHWSKDVFSPLKQGFFLDEIGHMCIYIYIHTHRHIYLILDVPTTPKMPWFFCCLIKYIHWSIR